VTFKTSLSEHYVKLDVRIWHAEKLGYNDEIEIFEVVGAMTRAGVQTVLNEHGILPTPQRVEIAGILLERPQHLSAEHVIDELRSRGIAVSKATVYNTLNLFSERGLIKEVMVDPERKFYDSTTHPHHHFYNVDTRELSDIPDDQVCFRNLPGLPEGTEQESVEVMIKVRNRRD
jgi:Fur family iron response transcriptional regulator